MNAKQSLSSISANQELWVEQFRQEMFERDIRSGLSAAKSEGIAIGESRGEKRGEERGRTETKLEAARKMLLKHIGTIEQIVEVTGLTEEKIRELAEKLNKETQL